MEVKGRGEEEWRRGREEERRKGEEEERLSEGEEGRCSWKFLKVLEISAGGRGFQLVIINIYFLNVGNV